MSLAAVPDAPPEAEFLSTAARAMSSERGDAALDRLSFWELLPELDDDEAAAAVFSALRAQGRALADTPALGGLLAQPFATALGVEQGTVVAAIRRDTPRRGEVWVAVGDTGGRRLLLDAPGRGTHVLDADAAAPQPVVVAGRTTVVELEVDLDGRAPDLPDRAAAPLRDRATYLARVGASAELLGAAERVVDLAVEYAGAREQFGRPIGTFQALRHLLAWAATDCVAVEAVVRRAVALRRDPPPRFGDAAKALAGRNGMRACQRALQAFGGIGFTAEHEHHHFHGRVLLLDALLGSSAELTHELGTWVRTSGDDPAYAEAVLHAGAP